MSTWLSRRCSGLQADLRTLKLSAESLGTRFDVALVDPPWEEYARRAPGLAQMDTWAWAEIQALELENVMDTPSFIFLWCAAGPLCECFELLLVDTVGGVVSSCRTIHKIHTCNPTSCMM